jgi:hypothetical protein
MKIYRLVNERCFWDEIQEEVLGYYSNKEKAEYKITEFLDKNPEYIDNSKSQVCYKYERDEFFSGYLYLEEIEVE